MSPETGSDTKPSREEISAAVKRGSRAGQLDAAGGSDEVKQAARRGLIKGLQSKGDHLKFDGQRLAKARQKNDSKAEDWYPSINAGKINPITGEGSGSEYDHSKGPLVIVGNPNGGELRAFNDKIDPETIGRRIRQTKQGGGMFGRDKEKTGLVILGYRDENGIYHGYVPNRQMNYFAMK